jgi:hypothetical protein
MEQSVLSQALTTIGIVIGLTLLWVIPLVTFLFFVSRRNARKQHEIEATWLHVGQSLGTSVSPPTRITGGIEMKGTYRDRPLRIYGSYGGRYSQDSTSVSVSLDLQADVYLQATRPKLMGIDYIPADDPELDQKYHFQSRPPSLLLSLSTDAAIHRMLVEGNLLRLQLTPYLATCMVNDIESNENQLKLMIQLLNDIADKVSAQIGSSIPSQAPPPSAAYEQTGKVIKLTGGKCVLLVFALAVLVIMVVAAVYFAIQAAAAGGA